MFDQTTAKEMLEEGASIDAIAKHFGVAWSTAKCALDPEYRERHMRQQRESRERRKNGLTVYHIGPRSDRPLTYEELYGDPTAEAVNRVQEMQEGEYLRRAPITLPRISIQHHGKPVKSADKSVRYRNPGRMIHGC